ncbi:hypothetical protein [Phenylobacterium sp.]|uniref:hypothetical protein n=1 Tax=Phenylobacterium sp. TaxID=1871053 RepID=UPI00286AD2F8|nr:hypothetical protein [Phenylobacterium sp.]
MVVIDGTGVYNTAQYDSDMKNSFCVQIANGMGSKATYYRGPGGWGGTTILRTWAGVSDILSSDEKNVMITGYSRGAAAAIELAHYCRDMAITVEAMFLFDPVKRDLALPNADTIPHNVRNCYKVLRAPSKDSNAVSFMSPNNDRYARGWMRNCGESVEDPSLTFVDTPCVISGSHGAAGGVPWGEYTPDKAATQMAADWMSTRLQKHGLKISLKNYWMAWHKNQ